MRKQSRNQILPPRSPASPGRLSGCDSQGRKRFPAPSLLHRVYSPVRAHGQWPTLTSPSLWKNCIPNEEDELDYLIFDILKTSICVYLVYSVFQLSQFLVSFLFSCSIHYRKWGILVSHYYFLIFYFFFSVLSMLMYFEALLKCIHRCIIVISSWFTGQFFTIKYSYFSPIIF